MVNDFEKKGEINVQKKKGSWSIKKHWIDEPFWFRLICLTLECKESFPTFLCVVALIYFVYISLTTKAKIILKAGVNSAEKWILSISKIFFSASSYLNEK